MKSDYYDYAVGQALANGKKAFLTAPSMSAISVGDVVVTNHGNYRVLFYEQCESPEGKLATALRVTLGNEPYRITKKLTEIIYKWEEEVPEDDTVRNQSADRECD